MGTGEFIAAGNLAMDTIQRGNTHSPLMQRETDKIQPDGLVQTCYTVTCSTYSSSVKNRALLITDVTKLLSLCILSIKEMMTSYLS